jgi:hypothetical protein
LSAPLHSSIGQLPNPHGLSDDRLVPPIDPEEFPAQVG